LGAPGNPARRAQPPPLCRYAALRQRGHSHGRLSHLADRLLLVACTLLEQQTLFDPTYEVHDAAGA
jgi:hypothetical protein